MKTNVVHLVSLFEPGTFLHLVTQRALYSILVCASIVVIRTPYYDNDLKHPETLLTLVPIVIVVALVTIDWLFIVFSSFEQFFFADTAIGFHAKR